MLNDLARACHRVHPRQGGERILGPQPQPLGGPAGGKGSSFTRMSPSAKVLVHCVVGVSRSATLVLAYLMLRQQMSLRQAVITVRQHRWVFPNRGFLHQLCQLDQKLRGAGSS